MTIFINDVYVWNRRHLVCFENDRKYILLKDILIGSKEVFMNEQRTIWIY